MSNISKHKIIFVADYKETVGKVYTKTTSSDVVPRVDSVNIGGKDFRVLKVKHFIKDSKRVHISVSLQPKEDWATAISVLTGNGFNRVPTIKP